MQSQTADTDQLHAFWMRLWPRLKRQSYLIGADDINQANIDKEHPVWEAFDDAAGHLAPDTLSIMGETEVPAIESFDPEAHFRQNARNATNPLSDRERIVRYPDGEAPPEVPIHWMSPEFRKLVGKTPKHAIPASRIRSFRNDQGETPLPAIERRLGKEWRIVPLAHVWHAMKAFAPNPKPGERLEDWQKISRGDGFLSRQASNCFFVQDDDGEIHIVQAQLVSLKREYGTARFKEEFRNSLIFERALGWHLSILERPRDPNSFYRMHYGTHFFTSKPAYLVDREEKRADAALRKIVLKAQAKTPETVPAKTDEPPPAGPASMEGNPPPATM